MSRTVLALVLVAASASAASAGTYLGLGIGTTAANPDSEQVGMEANGRSFRLMLGWKFGKLAVEGTGSRFDMIVGGSPFETTQLAAGVKFSLPLGNNFEAFGRGGLQRMWLNRQSDNGGNHSASGYYLGAGFEYRLNLGVTGASIFVDYTRAPSTFENEAMFEYDASPSMWTLGATVSL